MSSYSLLNRLNSSIIISYKPLFSKSCNILSSTNSCKYAKSAEERLGLEKPKRPLTPFVKFATQLRPALVSKNPNVVSKDIMKLASKHWQQLDLEVKAKMSKEYEKDIEDYKKIKQLYESSLTAEQKDEIKKIKHELDKAKEKRKLKAELKELGKPKRPRTSYMLFCEESKSLLKEIGLKEFSKQMQMKWANLDAVLKSKYEAQAKKLMDQFKKDLTAWEEKMLSLGHYDLIRTRKQPSEEISTIKSKSKKQ